MVNISILFFSDERMEAQRGLVTFPKITQLGDETSLWTIAWPDCKAHSLNHPISLPYQWSAPGLITVISLGWKQSKKSFYGDKNKQCVEACRARKHLYGADGYDVKEYQGLSKWILKSPDLAFAHLSQSSAPSHPGSSTSGLLLDSSKYVVLLPFTPLHTWLHLPGTLCPTPPRHLDLTSHHSSS